MSEDLEGTSRLHVRDQRWKVVLVFMVVLTVALLSLLVTSQLKRGGELSQRHLPQSIEEFRATLNQPDFGMYFVDFSGVLPKPSNELTLDNAKLLLYELMGRRHANSGSTESIGNLVADYSAVARKRVSFGRSWQRVTNGISYDDSLPRTQGETLAQIESILRTNGGFIFPLNRSNVVLLTEEDLKSLGHALPGNGK